MFRDLSDIRPYFDLDVGGGGGGGCDCSCHGSSYGGGYGGGGHSSSGCANATEAGSHGSGGYWSERGFASTPSTSVSTPMGVINGMHHTGGNQYGGTHHTVHADNGTRISWDTNSSGSVMSGTVHAQSGNKK